MLEAKLNEAGTLKKLLDGKSIFDASFLVPTAENVFLFFSPSYQRASDGRQL
jgi:hypothetical protein